MEAGKQTKIARRASANFLYDGFRTGDESHLLKVSAWGKPVGCLRTIPDSNRIEFGYDTNWLESGIELAPLTMPLKDHQPWSFADLNRLTYQELPGLFSDSLPDSFGEKAFRAIGFQCNDNRKPGGTPLEKLAFIGRHGMGALEYGECPFENHQAPIELHDWLEATKRLAKCRYEDWQASLFFDPIVSYGQYLKVGTSAGGAKPKALVAFDDQLSKFWVGDAGEVPNQKQGLLKFTGFESNPLIAISDSGRVEYAYYLLALKAGLRVAPSHLVKIDDTLHFLTERFDREQGKKLHYQSLCALAHMDLRARGKYDYLDVALVARKLQLEKKTLTELFRRIVFNVVMRNHDDHTKNMGFLMNETGKWQLAPAFDLTFSFNPSGRWTRTHRMGIMGKFCNIGKAELLELGLYFEVDHADDILEEICEVGNQWSRVALETGVSKTTCNAIGSQLRTIIR